MKNLDALYQQLVEADAKGDIQSAKQLQTEMKTLLFEEIHYSLWDSHYSPSTVCDLCEQLLIN